MRKAVLRVYRYDPEKGTRGYDEFEVEAAKGMSVLDALQRIKDELDGSLTFRYSCRWAICGSCAMKINGYEKLACKTLLEDELKRGKKVLIEPLGNLEVIKDLVVDMAPFWEKNLRIEPWLHGSDAQRVFKKEDFAGIETSGDCIMCMCCYAGCDVVRVDKDFLGPAALAKALRFAADPREGASKERLEKCIEGGLWWCTRSYRCYSQCPKDVKPTNRIVALRNHALNMGLTDDLGAKHVLAFSDTVAKSGKLNETTLPIKALWSSPMELLRRSLMAARMLAKGKLPSPLKKPIEKMEEVKELFEGGK